MRVAASAALIYMAAIASLPVRYIACVGDRQHCANETFKTLTACEAYNARAPYGDEASCLTK